MGRFLFMGLYGGGGLPAGPPSTIILTFPLKGEGIFAFDLKPTSSPLRGEDRGGGEIRDFWRGVALVDTNAPPVIPDKARCAADPELAPDPIRGSRETPRLA